MSRSHKRYFTYYRSIRGFKKATIHNLRSIPPNPWEDIKPDKQCWKASRVIYDLFNKGMDVDQIKKKVKANYHIQNWQWDNISYYINPTIRINFGELVAINEDESSTISVSTPNSEPCFTVKTRDLPIDNQFIVAENKILRHQYIEFENTNQWNIKRTEVNKIYPFPNDKLAEIFLFLREHYLENGMVYQYVIKKWQLGLHKCTIEFRHIE